MKFEQASLLWAEKRLHEEGIQFDEIESVKFEADTYRYSYCGSCGSFTGIEHNAEIWYIRYNYRGTDGYRNPDRMRHEIEEMELYDLLQELFEVSEHGHDEANP